MSGKVIYNKAGGYTGFIGNVMFQTAATIGIAVKNNMSYCFPHKEYHNYFKGDIPQPSFPQPSMIDHNEHHYHFTDVILNPSQNYNLTGYYQSEKYWSHCESLIKNIFSYNDDIVDYVDNKYSFLFNKGKVLVSIHVRRGDYLTLPNHHPVLPLSYYIDASKEISSLVNMPITYVVFSDDMAWCRENFDEELLNGSIVFADANTPIQDMCLISLCDHNIIANSSFSWWGSYLNNNIDKIIVAPTKDKWYGSEYKHWNLDDLYLSNWILK